MKKLLNPKEWIGTGVQLIIFVLLMPYLSILLGIIMESAPSVKDEYAAAVMSFLPYADPIQNVITGLNLASPQMSVLTYGTALLETISGNVIAAMYLGGWLYAFRVIFKEMLGDALRLRGLPILQTVCGLFFGAMTFTMLDDEMMRIPVTLFIFLLDAVLTLIFVRKSVLKKILDIAINLSLQSYLAALTIGYIAVLSNCVRGYYTNVTQAATAVVVVTLLWIVYLVAQYLLTDK